MPDENPSEFSRRVARADIERGPVQLNFAAEPQECSALAKRFGVLSVESLSLDVAIRHFGPDVYRAEGLVQGQAMQRCVVTLQPVLETICEAFCIDFTENAMLAEDIDEECDADIEPFSGDSIDVGEVAAQHFALGLNPYPRRADAEPVSLTSGPATAADADSERESPFSVLAHLLDNEKKTH